ncbi:putative adhesion G protein-coupled receptor E4P [Physella acuta]|uniref:putative adhesion G protein-coupled receptor E4P n=1 Tax=Physella acuta TaxID=109671 RepID=UPI0027DDD1CB|nr:putative adhesion G protein-coupled receptor E4P [Physella acuta]
MRDEFETAITQTLINTHISLDIGTHGNVSFRTVAMVTAHEYILLDTMESPSRNVLSMVSENYHSQKGLIAYSNSFLNISNLLWCSYVSFNKTSYTIEVDETRAPPKINIELDLVGTRITFSEFSELNMLALDGDGVLNVCRQLLDTKLGQMDLKASRVVDLIDPDIVKAEYILTVVLLAVSMGCLLLTVMTYMCFTKLRSRAGKSNMCLSGSLLLAQGSLLASSHLSGPSWLCTAVGVSTHFLWLWMFTWTFICSFQMFRVFTAKTRGSALTSREETCQFVRQVCLSLLAPLLVVTSVIVTSLATNDDGGTGYGNTVCYLDSTLLIGVALVLPLSLIIVTNLTFFITTVVIIYRVGQLQSKDHARREDRKNLFVYAKLSSMTGAFWIFAIVAEATDLSALRFLSIVMNGLQGVCIFLSYTFNKRVLNLYLVSAGLEPLPTSRFSSEIKSRTESTSVRH